MGKRITISLPLDDTISLIETNPAICYDIDYALKEKHGDDYEAIKRERWDIISYIYPSLIRCCINKPNKSHIIASFITGLAPCVTKDEFGHKKDMFHKLFTDCHIPIFGLDLDYFHDLTKYFVRFLTPMQIIQMPNTVMRCIIWMLVLKSPHYTSEIEERYLNELGYMEFCKLIGETDVLERLCRSRDTDAFMNASLLLCEILKWADKSKADDYLKKLEKRREEHRSMRQEWMSESKDSEKDSETPPDSSSTPDNT